MTKKTQTTASGTPIADELVGKLAEKGLMICSKSSRSTYFRQIGSLRSLASSGSSASGSIVFASMPKRTKQQSHDLEGERVRRSRLRADGQRPLGVNLKETISLTRKLFELRDSARRGR
jgi:hypothetical protein